MTTIRFNLINNERLLVYPMQVHALWGDTVWKVGGMGPFERQLFLFHFFEQHWIWRHRARR